MNSWILFFMSIITGYIVGAIPFSLLIGKLWGVDIRKHGSGNVGAANVFRCVNSFAGTMAILLDAGKGVLAVLLVRYLLSGENQLLILTGVAAVLGHVYSVFLKFKGGKGAATSAGIMLVFAPFCLLSSAVMYVLGYVLSKRISSVGTMTGALTFPVFIAVYAFLLPPLAAGMYPLSFSYLMTATLFLLFLIIIRHRSNIQRLFAHKENHFGKA